MFWRKRPPLHEQILQAIYAVYAEVGNAATRLCGQPPDAGETLLLAWWVCMNEAATKLGTENIRKHLDCVQMEITGRLVAIRDQERNWKAQALSTREKIIQMDSLMTDANDIYTDVFAQQKGWCELGNVFLARAMESDDDEGQQMTEKFIATYLADMYRTLGKAFRT